MGVFAAGFAAARSCQRQKGGDVGELERSEMVYHHVWSHINTYRFEYHTSYIHTKHASMIHIYLK